MPFRDFAQIESGVLLLQRSLERGRLAHAYLFTGHELGILELAAKNLAQTLNCLRPLRSPNGAAIDACGVCLSCRKIEHANHADVHWVQPESKSRVITVEQMRQLMSHIQLKPTEAAYKFAVIVAADRLRVEAANAFLKTLEEPPPRSIIILLSCEPERILETVISRCLRVSFITEGTAAGQSQILDWLKTFSELAAADQTSLLSRYRLMDVLLRQLNEARASINERLTAKSPLEQYPEVEKELRDKWEEQLAASIEAEYRRERADLLRALQRWLRDVWLRTLGRADEGSSTAGGTSPRKVNSWPDQLLNFPSIGATERIARRISLSQATENLQIVEELQQRLATNVQEALALEVGMLKLRL